MGKVSIIGWTVQIDVIIIMDVCVTVFKLSAPFSEILHSHYAIIIHFSQLVMKFNVEICFVLKNPNTLSTSWDRVSNAIAIAY